MSMERLMGLIVSLPTSVARASLIMLESGTLSVVTLTLMKPLNSAVPERFMKNVVLTFQSAN